MATWFHSFFATNEDEPSKRMTFVQRFLKHGLKARIF